MKKTLLIGAAVCALTLGAVPEALADWTGAYVGGYASRVVVGMQSFGTGGGQAGYSFERGRMVLGVEGQLGLQVISGNVIGETNAIARAGVSLGTAGRALLYVEGGVGLLIVPGSVGFTLAFGGGLEVSISPTFSVFAEQKFFGAPGGIVACCAPQIQFGVNWRP